MLRPVVLSLGGSLVVPQEIDIVFLKRFKSFITKLSENRKVLISVGGGATARKYLAASRALAVFATSKSGSADDLLGIQATRLNARFIKNILGNKAHEEIIVDPTKKMVTSKNILIAGGYKPGASSDHVAVLLARTYGAKELVNLSNTDYIYTKDPKKADAKRCAVLTWSQLQEIVGKRWMSSGHFPFDPIATTEARKSNLILYAIHGKRLNEVTRALEHKPFKGSTVKGK